MLCSTTRRFFNVVGAVALAAVSAFAQQSPGRNPLRVQAEVEVPKLVEVLDLKPGMTVADVGAGFGFMSFVLAKWIGPGRVFATDFVPMVEIIQKGGEDEGLANITVVEGAAGATNLPSSCCDAIFLRDVYHHLTEAESLNKSLLASLKVGGRLAIIDFVATKGTKLPEGVPANRGGHGIPPLIVIAELTAVGFVHVKTVDVWPTGERNPAFPAYYLVLFKKN